jgi:hypothetical protein
MARSRKRASQLKSPDGSRCPPVASLDQLYRTYADTTAGIYEGIPFLKPETLEGGEVGLDFNQPGFRSQLILNLPMTGPENGRRTHQTGLKGMRG